MGFSNEFPIPQSIEVNESTDNYAKFTAAPFQSGFGHTIGNSLRRVLLSSLKGAAISAVRIDGVTHEFATIPKVIEDVAEIILNLKKVLFITHTGAPKTLELKKTTAGPVRASDIAVSETVEILNPDQIICTLDKNISFRAELDISEGRGYRPSDKNKSDSQPVGTIPIDSNFSPVRRVRYQVGAARVGEETEMDSLVLEVWTDGRITPQSALEKAAKILREHLRPFFGKSETQDASALVSDDEKVQFTTLAQSVETLNLSVRSQNCLNNAGIRLLGELCMKTEAKMLKYKNFGKKSLDEIILKLKDKELSLGMTFSESMTKALQLESSKSNPNKVADSTSGEDSDSESAQASGSTADSAQAQTTTTIPTPTNDNDQESK